MTITGVRNQVIAVLLKNERFVLSEDRNKIKVPKSLASVKDQLVESAFEALEQTKFVVKVKTADDVVWVVECDPALNDQTIHISPYTAEAIANIINQYREAMGIQSGECDKTRIIEEDFQSLIIICGSLLNNVEKKPEAEDEESEDYDGPGSEGQ